MKHKIAMVTAFPPSKGSLNEYGYHLAMEFAERKDVEEVVIIADRIDANVPEPLHHPKIRVVRCWGFNEISTPLNILRALRGERPAGVLYNLQTATFGDRELPAAVGFLTPLLGRLFGIRSGALVHNLIEGIDLENTILKGNSLRQALVRLGGYAISFSLTRANYVTATLELYTDILKRRFPGSDVTMVPHGTFRADHAHVTPLENRPVRIVTMGKFGTYKRLETLLDAFELVHAENREVELVIGGTDHPNTPGYVAGLQRKYADHPAIRFAGYVAEEDVAGFFSSARMAVFDYSATTGSSGVLHQCASYGTLPVFPRIGDFVELCEREGLAGLNYNALDPVSLKEVINAGLRDTQMASQLAAGNLEASMACPLSSVADFHMAKLTGELCKESPQASINPVNAPTH